MRVPVKSRPCTRIQQRHIQRHDGLLLFLCDYAPLIKGLVIIPSQSINALDHQRITAFQFSKEALILGSVKIFPAYFIYIYIFPLYSELVHCHHLKIFALVLAGYTNLSIAFSYHFLPPDVVMHTESTLTYPQMEYI